MSEHRSLEHFSVDSRYIRESNELRLDASFYNPRVAKAIQALEKSGFEITTLDSVVKEIFIPPRFKRIYVDKDHGIPFLQGSHIVHFQPADLKYLSTTAQRNLAKWIIHAGWILVTCSGTIGRVTIAAQEWDGWAASQHILRIVPDSEKCLPGYLCAFLSSPIGQVQLTAQIYGAVVDELTEQQAKRVLVPIPRTKQQREQAAAINELALKAVEKRAEASKMATEAVDRLGHIMPQEEPLVQEAAILERLQRDVSGSSGG